MKNYHTFLYMMLVLFLSLSTMMIILTCLKLNSTILGKKPDKSTSIPVYCLMITGQNEFRRSYAKISIKNFLLQTYANKNLIILNQSKSSLVSKDYTNILEVFIDEPHSLGTLRNISLQFVPPNAIWTTWDDDDWRHTQYLTTMISIFNTKQDIEFMMFQNRLEYNVITNYMFRSKMKHGTMIFFAKQNPYLAFSDKDVLEDVELKQYALGNLKYYIYNNDPKMYLRLIHQSNTSVYVDPEKHKLKNNQNAKTYFEFEASEADSIYINNIISKEYKNVL